MRKTTFWIGASTRFAMAAGALAGFAGSVNADCVNTWDNTVGQPGLNSAAFAFTEYHGDLYAVGQFVNAGGVTVNRIARWGGGNIWHPVGGGVNGAILGATVYDDTLVIVGGFNVVGSPGMTAHRVARWDGSAWSTFDDMSAWAVRAAIVYNDELIVGGEIITASGVDAHNIIRWDVSSNTWQTLSGGVNGVVHAFALFEGDLIVGGAFTTAGSPGVTVNRAARWDGSEWSPMGSGMDGQVSALYVYNGELYAGGQFTGAGGQPAGYIARWNPNLPGGGNWEPFGGGVSSWVNRLIEFEGDLVAGGLFTLAGGTSGIPAVAANRIARWDDDGQTWHALGSGVDWTFLPTVAAMGVYEGDLFVSGQFNIAGGLSSNFVAVWTGCPGDPDPGIPGDLTGSGSVGVEDLLILLSQWGPCADCAPGMCPADLTGDCAVGVGDLLFLLANWG